MNHVSNKEGLENIDDRHHKKYRFLTVALALFHCFIFCHYSIPKFLLFFCFPSVKESEKLLVVERKERKMIGFDLFFDCGILRFEGTKLVNNFLLGGSLGGFLANSQKTLSNAGT